MKHWQLSEDNEELIHRVFGGAKLDAQLRCDVYRTECDNIVLVNKFGATFVKAVKASSPYTFKWDKPL